jgi:hypothetical protein
MFSSVNLKFTQIVLVVNKKFRRLTVTGNALVVLLHAQACIKTIIRYKNL